MRIHRAFVSAVRTRMGKTPFRHLKNHQTTFAEPRGFASNQYRLASGIFLFFLIFWAQTKFVHQRPLVNAMISNFPKQVNNLRQFSLNENFRFVFFIGKFVFSKFGVFFLFFAIHLTSRLSWGFIFSKEFDRTKQLSASPHVSIGIRLRNNSIKDPGALMKKGSLPISVLKKESLTTPDLTLEKRSLCNLNVGSENFEVFHKMKNYCIICTIVTLFLNPQQTKYFGGLAVVLKQAGFFTKYSKSEKSVYMLSWVCIILFFSFSIQIGALLDPSMQRGLFDTTLRRLP